MVELRSVPIDLHQPPLAKIVLLTGVSIIIPTYREVLNIPHIIARIAAMKQAEGMELEVIIMDDNSQDGSVEAVAALGLDWIRIVVRRQNRGLSPSVIDGFKLARYPVLVCMDCDLSHPPEKIADMVLVLQSGQQFVLGSRYVSGGSTDDDWGLFRWLNSRVATWLARPLTKVRDPMSGFMAMRRSDFLQANDLNPVGYKIALEMIVKCGFDNVGEVPIRFVDRQYGQSKLTFKEQLKYIVHLRRLYIHKFGTAMHFAQFLVVGFSGAIVNLLVLTGLLGLGTPVGLSLAGGIAVSVVTNIWKQFAGFIAASSVGMLVNYFTALYLQAHVFTSGSYRLQLAALVGILAGMTFNFVGNRYVVFRKKYIKDRAPENVE
jgi:dolichol-phosphate mannosyltransferase